MNKTENGTVSRRTFLKTAGIAGLGAAATGALAACSPASPTSSASGAATEGTAGIIGGALSVTDWLGQPPVIEDAADAGTFDVVIIGAGNAGCQAALAAAQQGASVAVIEALPEDTYTAFGEDICGYNSDFMIAHGYGPYNLSEITAEYVRRGAGRLSPELVRKFVDNSGEMFDNLVEIANKQSGGQSTMFDDNQFIVHHAYNKEKGSDYPILFGGFKSWATTYQSVGTSMTNEYRGRTGVSRLTEINLYCMGEAQDLGAKFFFDHSAVCLAQDGDHVTGAYAEGPDGTVLLNATKGVILATGDFSANGEMVYNLIDDVNEWNARIGRTGEEITGMGRNGMGHKLGCWAGGAMEPHPRASNNIGAGPGPFGTVPMLLLNANGDRFMNEAMSAYIVNQMLRQPFGLVAHVADKNYLQSVQKVGLDHGAPNWGAPLTIQDMADAIDALGDTGPEGANVPQIAIINIQMGARIEGLELPAGGAPEGAPIGAPGGMEGGPGSSAPNIWKADKLEDLLSYMGYEGAALENALAVIDRYNELCEKGVDEDYGKDAIAMIPIKEPPFIGSVTTNVGESTAGLVTLCGLLTDSNMNVQKADRSGAIEGLYAVGNCLGQRYAICYAAPSAGNSIGMALTHGRVCGKYVASL